MRRDDYTLGNVYHFRHFIPQQVHAEQSEAIHFRKLSRIFRASLECLRIMMKPLSSSITYLTDTARQLLHGCQVKAQDGTVLYTPDGRGNYAALWTRDFAYMVENAADLMPAEHVEGCIRYLIKGQREDGVVPDRVRPDGVPVYVAGPENNPLGEPNLDNPMFLVIACDTYLKRVSSNQRKSLFTEWSPALDKGMEWVPRNPQGLVFNNPDKPHSPYGFTDCIGKTGELLMESLLYWTASVRMEHWHRQYGNTPRANDYRRRARQIETNLSRLWDEAETAFLAASVDCRQVDVWGNAYAVAVGFPLGSRKAKIQRLLIQRIADYSWKGQIRHLFKGEYWKRLLLPIPRDRYQNGAFWATASGWVLLAIHPVDPKLAEQTYEELISDFQHHGVFECIHPEHRQLDSYVVSACNPLGAARKLWAR